jgi:hypothetical protein
MMTSAQRNPNGVICMARFIAAVITVVTLGVAATAAHAQGIPDGAGTGASSCARTESNTQGGAAHTEAYNCAGGGLIFVAPAIGQVASLVAPTIIGPAVVTNMLVSNGNGIIGVVP